MSVYAKRRFMWLWAPGILAGNALVVADMIRTYELTGLGFIGLAVLVVFGAAFVIDD